MKISDLFIFNYGENRGSLQWEKAIVNLKDASSVRRVIDLLESEQSSSIKWVDRRESKSFPDSPITITMKTYVQADSVTLSVFIEPHNPNLAYAGGDTVLTMDELNQLIEALREIAA